MARYRELPAVQTDHTRTFPGEKEGGGGKKPTTLERERNHLSVSWEGGQAFITGNTGAEFTLIEKGRDVMGRRAAGRKAAGSGFCFSSSREKRGKKEGKEKSARSSLCSGGREEELVLRRRGKKGGRINSI